MHVPLPTTGSRFQRNYACRCADCKPRPNTERHMRARMIQNRFLLRVEGNLKCFACLSQQTKKMADSCYLSHGHTRIAQPAHGRLPSHRRATGDQRTAKQQKTPLYVNSTNSDSLTSAYRAGFRSGGSRRDISYCSSKEKCGRSRQF